ncbi:MFS transporter [Jeotgalibacillus terrae]|uniref:MFS transporter n=1 Tax=Jeotgalibacillus terrae TaxID=587735 RepID=A0ABW5ZGT6_9BACL|nr:MFS transporter [Jeotgalibacillus terrae]MBM7578571.1 putative MFS family arabinose efflux permease [Jeotgalibacillus terrae]
MWKFVLPGLAMIGVTFAFARFSFGLFLPDISETLSLSENNAGFIGSTAYASYTLALITSSYFIRKWGQVRVIQFAGWSAILGLSGIAFSPNFLILALSTFIAGLGSGWASPAYAQVAGNSLKDKDKDRGNTWMNSGTSFGLIVSGPIALFFTAHWRFSFILFAVIAFVVTVWNTRKIPSKSSQTDGIEQPKWLPSIKKAKFLLLASFITGISSSIFWTFSRSYLTDVHTMSDVESVVFWILMGAAGMVGAAAGGFINKFGLGLSYRLTVTFMMVALAVITIPVGAAIYGSAIFFGITYIFMTGIFIVWATRIFTNFPSMGVGLSFLFLGAGQSIGSFVAGGTIDGISYPFSFILFAVIGLAGLIVPTRISKEVSELDINDKKFSPVLNVQDRKGEGTMKL